MNFQALSISFQGLKGKVFIFADSSYVWNENKKKTKKAKKQKEKWE